LISILGERAVPFIALRRLMDVLLPLAPLLLAGPVTLEICVFNALTLNFAKIITLPLLLGVGNIPSAALNIPVPFSLDQDLYDRRKC
jgi:hypothetical protein